MTRESHELGRAIANLASTRTALAVTIVGGRSSCCRRHWRGAIALALVFPVTQGAVQLDQAGRRAPAPGREPALAERAGLQLPERALGHQRGRLRDDRLHPHPRGTPRSQPRRDREHSPAALVLAVGFSRVLLGAHYPTDVLAGWTFGALVASLCWLVAHRGCRCRGCPSAPPSNQRSKSTDSSAVRHAASICCSCSGSAMHSICQVRPAPVKKYEMEVNSPSSTSSTPDIEVADRASRVFDARARSPSRSRLNSSR